MTLEMQIGKVIEIRKDEELKRSFVIVENSNGEILESKNVLWYSDRFKIGDEVIYGYSVDYKRIGMIWNNQYWEYVKSNIPDADVLKQERYAAHLERIKLQKIKIAIDKKNKKKYSVRKGKGRKI